MKKTTIVITDESITVTHENENGQVTEIPFDDRLLKRAMLEGKKQIEVEKGKGVDIVSTREPKGFKTEKEIMTYAGKFVAQARYGDALEFLEGKKKAFGTQKVLAAIAELRAIISKDSVIKRDDNFEVELPPAIKKEKKQPAMSNPTTKDDFDEIVKDEIETTDDDGFDYGTGEGEDNEEEIFGN